MKEFELDDETKEFIQKTATLFGVDSNLIKEVYEYMLFTWLLKIANSDTKVNTITIPYLGHIGLRYGDESLSNSSENNKSIEPEIDSFVVLNDEFKKMLYEVHTNKNTALSEFIQTNLINKLIDNIDKK